MTDIIIQGIGGRMGHVLCEMIAQREDCRVIAGIDVKDGEQNGIPVYDSLEKLDGKGDVVIDFSSPRCRGKGPALLRGPQAAHRGLHHRSVRRAAAQGRAAVPHGACVQERQHVHRHQCAVRAVQARVGHSGCRV